MELEVLRYNQEKDFTDGIFKIDGKFQCFTIEDEVRTQKVYGETAIPLGRYKVEFRTEGGFNQRYLNKYGSEFHKGMLWIKDVPNFEYILIHIGNDDDDTAGCLLVGMSQNADKQGFLGSSGAAYKNIYPIVRDAILRGEEVCITYKEI